MTVMSRSSCLVAAGIALSAALAGCHGGPPGKAAAPSGTSVRSSAAASSRPAVRPSGTGSAPTVVTSRIALGWQFPKGAEDGSVVRHSYPVPPLPVLRAISVGRHEDERPAYDRISFTFTGTFPGYELRYQPEASAFSAGPSGRPVHVEGGNTLLVHFTGAAAHDASGRRTVPSAPVRAGYPAIAGYAQLGDFEGVLGYGIGNSGPGVVSPSVRAVEVKQTDPAGGYRYVVAIDIQTAALGSASACPSAATLRAAAQRGRRGDTVTQVQRIACTGGWAIAEIAIAPAEGQAWAQSALFREQGGQWVLALRSACTTGQVPPALEEFACHTS